MKIKHKMKDKVTIILMIIITIINISSISDANLIGKQFEITAREYNIIPYTYGSEERKAVLRFTNSNMPVYSIEKNNLATSFTMDNIEFYNDEVIKNIIKNGYGCKTLEELGANNIEEAYLATQEAIYIKKEGRNIDNYHIIEGEEIRANAILNLTKEILKNALNEKSTTLEVTTNDTKWKTYESNNNYKYKEYTIKSTNTIPGDITIQKGEDIRLIDKSTNETKTRFSDKDVFYLIVPKDLEQEIKIQFNYEMKDTTLYVYKITDDLKDKYLIAEEENRISSAIFTEKLAIENNVEILNQDKETKLPIIGNIFSIIKEDGTVINSNLETNEEGKISTRLSKGKYYLKQTNTINGYNLNKALIQIDVNNEENIKIKVESTRPITEEVITINKETNIIEENKNVTEKNIKEISNIKITNINKEIINETNETNLHNVNNFINTINRKNVTNLKKENTYNNDIEEIFTKDELLEGEDITLHKTRKDYVNYIDMVMFDSARVPILPVASK